MNPVEVGFNVVELKSRLENEFPILKSNAKKITRGRVVVRMMFLWSGEEQEEKKWFGIFKLLNENKFILISMLTQFIFYMEGVILLEFFANFSRLTYEVIPKVL